MKTKRKIIIIIVAYCVFLAIYSQVPDFKEYSSHSIKIDNYLETTLKVIVHKAHYNKYQYQLIDEHHSQINGFTPDKLTLELYFSEYAIKKGKSPYRTVVIDHANNISYVLLDY